jgi:hypothetical protein
VHGKGEPGGRAESREPRRTKAVLIRLSLMAVAGNKSTGSPSSLSLQGGARGGRKNKTRKRRTSAPARKKKYARTYFYFLFVSAFLGVSRQGEFENTRKQMSAFQKKSPGKYFFGGGGGGFGGIFFKCLSFRCFCCVG